MTVDRRIQLLAIVVTGVLTKLAAQEAPASEVVTIVSPAEDAYVAGPTSLRARIEPSAAVENVIFFVDGRQACVMSKPPFECDWDAGGPVIEHQVRLVATFAGGRRVVRTARTKALAYAESVDVDAVQVTATVIAHDGHYVKGLPGSAFHVFEDGKPQTISHFESEDVPLDLVVALDISGSMTAAMPKLKEAAKEFLATVPARDKVTVLGFNDSIFTLTRNSTDPAERAAVVERIAPWGGTALYDVIVRGVDLLGRQSGRKAIVVFTDGEDQGSRTAIEEVERRLQSSDVTIYVIAQGRGTSLDPLKKIMLRLSQPTGGRALFTQKIEQLREAFAELLDELSNQYLLGYSPTNTLRDDKLRHIKVEVDGHRAVRARQSYRAASAETK
jgi:Ca-activated chloride channel family protein